MVLLARVEPLNSLMQGRRTMKEVRQGDVDGLSCEEKPRRTDENLAKETVQSSGLTVLTGTYVQHSCHGAVLGGLGIPTVAVVVGVVHRRG